MKFSKKLIFLAIILIVVSIISIYFGSIKMVEGATVTCPGGIDGTPATDAAGNDVLNCPDTAPTTTTTPTTTAPAAASCTGIVCAAKITDCTSKKAYSNQKCCPTGKTACQPK